MMVQVKHNCENRRVKEKYENQLEQKEKKQTGKLEDEQENNEMYKK